MQKACLTGLLLVVALAGVAFAKPIQDQYFEAEDCYKKLRNSRSHHSIRENWLPCIKAFQDVTEAEPDGPWAAAGLYRSGELYGELYGHFFHESDKEEAVKIFEHVISRYPKSRYQQKASEAVQRIRRYNSPSQRKKEVRAPWNEDPKTKYMRAEQCSRELRGNPGKEKYRENWLACIEKYRGVYEIDPKGPWAAAGLYMAGSLYEGLYLKSFRRDDREKAVEMYRQIISEFTESRYTKKAADRLAALCGSGAAFKKRAADASDKPVSTPVRDQTAGAAIRTTPVASGKFAPEKPSAKKTTITEIRYWSNPSYTRIVIDGDQFTAFDHNLLKKDPLMNKPPRLYIDLKNSRLSADIQKVIPIDDNLLSGVRAGQYAPDTVRVVVDIKSFQTYKVFPMSDPFRIIVDVWGEKPGPPQKIYSPPLVTEKGKIPSRALAKQLALGVGRVIIDPGHGGKDPGAPGYLRGIHEKEVTLRIARRLAEKIRASLNCEAILTRCDDRYLTLEERTAIANTKNADLFVSIHANAHNNRNTHGVETYFLNLATDDESIRVAARENATSTKNISDLHSILSDLMQNAKINESSRLAFFVQESMVRKMKTHYSDVKNNGVKQAPFYVLLGAQMPAILIETSFISNPRECNRLVSAEYQNRLCEGIVKGIKKYIDETNPNKIAGLE